MVVFLSDDTHQSWDVLAARSHILFTHILSPGICFSQKWATGTVFVRRKTPRQSRSLSALLINRAAFRQPHRPRRGSLALSKPSSFWLAVHRASPCAWPAKKRETYPALLRVVEDTAAWLESGGRLESPAQEQAPSAASWWRQVGWMVRRSAAPGVRHSWVWIKPWRLSSSGPLDTSLTPDTPLYSPLGGGNGN